MKRHLLRFLKILIYTKGVIWRDTFHNSTNSNIYTKGVSSRDLLQFQKIRFILKVSLEKTLSTILQNPICIKNCENDFKAKDVSLQHKFEIFYYVWKLWKVSLENTLSV